MYNFITDCVREDGRTIDNMLEKEQSTLDINRGGKSLTADEFEDLVGTEVMTDFANSLGQSLEFIKGDYHVSYSQSYFRGVPCAFITHSAIEHIFIDDKYGERIPSDTEFFSDYDEFVESVEELELVAASIPYDGDLDNFIASALLSNTKDTLNAIECIDNLSCVFIESKMPKEVLLDFVKFNKEAFYDMSDKFKEFSFDDVVSRASDILAKELVNKIKIANPDLIIGDELSVSVKSKIMTCVKENKDAFEHANSELLLKDLGNEIEELIESTVDKLNKKEQSKEKNKDASLSI